MYVHMACDLEHQIHHIFLSKSTNREEERKKSVPTIVRRGKKRGKGTEEKGRETGRVKQRKLNQIERDRQGV